MTATDFFVAHGDKVFASITVALSAVQASQLLHGNAAAYCALVMSILTLWHTLWFPNTPPTPKGTP